MYEDDDDIVINSICCDCWCTKKYVCVWCGRKINKKKNPYHHTRAVWWWWWVWGTAAEKWWKLRINNAIKKLWKKQLFCVFIFPLSQHYSLLSLSPTWVNTKVSERERESEKKAHVKSTHIYIMRVKKGRFSLIFISVSIDLS